MAREVAEKALADLASRDFVEVVRCRDCYQWKYELFRDNIRAIGLCRDPHWALPNDCTFPVTEGSDYCSYGEKRDDNN